MMAKSTYVYSDMHPLLNIDGSGEVIINYDIDAIITSIKNIIAIVSGEQVRNPVGSRIIRFLFEPITPSTALGIKDELRNIIQTYEPRVNVSQISVRPNVDGNYYDIAMILSVAALDTTQTFSTKIRSYGVN